MTTDDGAEAARLRADVRSGKLRVWALDAATYSLVRLKAERGLPGYLLSSINGQEAVLDEEQRILFTRR